MSALMFLLVSHAVMVIDPRAKTVPSTWKQPLDDWGTSLHQSGRSPETIATRLDHVRRTARAVKSAPWDVTFEELFKWASRQSWSRESRRSIYTSLRQFFAWAVETGLVAQSPAADLPRVKTVEPSPRPCPEEVIRIAKTTAEPRVALMLRLGSELGLRRRWSSPAEWCSGSFV